MYALVLLFEVRPQEVLLANEILFIGYPVCGTVNKLRPK